MSKPEDVGVSTERLNRIGETMRKLIDEKKIPGTVTLVLKKERLFTSKRTGCVT